MNITNVTGSEIPEWVTLEQVVFSGVIVLVGIPGNMLIIITFAYSPGKSSTDFMVFSMGVSDLLGSAVCATMNLLRFIPVVWARLGSKWFCRTFEFFTVSTGGISSLILGLVAFERYMKTCRPFSDVLTTSRTKLVCISLYVLVTILIAPTFGIERFDYRTGACFIIDHESKWSIVLYVITILSFLSYIFTAVAYTRIAFALCFRLKLKQKKRFCTREVSGCRNSKEYSGEVANVEQVELSSVISSVSTIQVDINNLDDCEKANSSTVSDTTCKISKGNKNATHSKGKQSSFQKNYIRKVLNQTI
jgi:hypothetical protein